MVELHVVLDLPAIERAAELDLTVAWAPVVEVEGVGLFLESFCGDLLDVAIELGGDLLFIRGRWRLDWLARVCAKVEVFSIEQLSLL